MALRPLEIAAKRKRRGKLANDLKDAEKRQRQLRAAEAALETRLDSDETITDQLEQEVQENAEALTAVEEEIEAIKDEIAAIDEELADVQDGAGTGDDGTGASRGRAPPAGRPTGPVDSANYRSRSRCFTSRSQRDAFYQRDDMKQFLQRVRALGAGSTRSITGADLTIPTVMLDTLRDNLRERSKLITKVRLREVDGIARVNIMGKVPEGVWTEMCANLNELEFQFTQIEVDGYMVGGFIPICKSTLSDSDINLGEEIMDMLLRAIGLALDKAIVYGVGPSMKMPVGFVTRLAQAEKPVYWGVNEGLWTDLHNANILQLDLATKNGVEFFQTLLAAMGKADPAYSTGGTTWVMNRKTHMDLKARGLAFDANGTLVAGLSNAMPVENGEIVELEFMPDFEFAGGFLEQYILAEREGGTVERSDHVRFLANQVVFKGTARYDARPAIGESFILVNYHNVAPTTSIDFAPDLANQRFNSLIVTASAGSKSGATKLAVAGNIGAAGNSLGYYIGASTEGIVPGHKAKGFTPYTAGEDIIAPTGTQLVVVELNKDNKAVSLGIVSSVAASA